MDKARNFKIEGVSLNWARLDSPVNPFGTEQYELQIATADKAKAEELKSNFFNVKEKDGMFTVSLKRKAKKADGSDNGKVRVVNSDLSPMENTKIIGNGSIGNVVVFQYPYSAAGRSGIANSLTAVQVVKLEKYEAAASADFSAVVSDTAEVKDDAKPVDLF